MNVLRILIPILLLAACSGEPRGSVTHGPRVTQVPGSARSGDLVAYIGIVPAAVARERMAADATVQHPAPAATADSHHLVVALFDAVSGTRIEEAVVVATRLSPRRPPVRRALIPMRTGDVISFGGEFEISKGPGHLFEIEAKRPGRTPASFSFSYDNQH